MKKYLVVTMVTLLTVGFAGPAFGALTLNGCVLHLNAQNIDGAGTVGTTGGVDGDTWTDLAGVTGYNGTLSSFDGTAGSGWEPSTAVPGAGMLQLNDAHPDIVWLANNAPDTHLSAAIETNTWTVETWVEAASTQITVVSAGRSYPITADGSGYHVGSRYSWHGAVEYPSMHARVFTADGVFDVFGDTDTRGGGLQHLVYQYDGSAVNLYLNGNLDGTAAATGDMDWTNESSWNTQMMIGGKYITSYWDEMLRGDLYAVRVYNRALSLAEIQGNNEAGAGAVPEPATLLLLVGAALGLLRRR